MNDFLCWLGFHKTVRRVINFDTVPESGTFISYCTRGHHVAFTRRERWMMLTRQWE